MDWLDKAAESFKKSSSEQERYEEVKKKVIEQYPDMVKKLWGMFEVTFKEIEEKFGKKTGFEVQVDRMNIVIGDVLIKGAAYNTEKAGGFTGTANVIYEVLGVTGGPPNARLDLLISINDGNPLWVFRADRNGVTQNIPFEQSHVEEYFKKALWKYLR